MISLIPWIYYYFLNNLAAVTVYVYYCIYMYRSCCFSHFIIAMWKYFAILCFEFLFRFFSCRLWWYCSLVCPYGRRWVDAMLVEVLYFCNMFHLYLEPMIIPSVKSYTLLSLIVNYFKCISVKAQDIPRHAGLLSSV